jgi:hypothetical protein
LSLLVAGFYWRRLLDPRVLAWCGAAALLGVVMILPYLLGFSALKQEADMTRGLDWSLEYSTDLGTSLLRSPALLYRGLLDGHNPSKGGALYPGLLTLLLAAIGVFRGDKARVRLLLLVIAVFFLLSLGPELRVNGRSLVSLPFKVLFERVPFFDAMRHPITLCVPATMALSLLAVIGLHSAGWARRPWALALVLGIAVAETLPATPSRVDHGTALPEAYRFLARQPPGAILELPFEGNYGYEWWSISHRMPLVNGELGFEPRWYAQLFHLIGREWGRRPPGQDMEEWASVRYLKGQLPLRYLILHRGTSGYVAANVEATARTFELIHETAAGDRIFLVRRGGVGPELKRRFRDDQLAGGKIVTRLSGPAGTVVAATLNDVALGERTLGPAAQGFGWSLPRAAVERGLNVFTLKAGDGQTRFELEDLEAR